MISKELLSAVLGQEVFKVREELEGEFDPCLRIEYEGGLLLLNIHELAHKVKEWAYTKGEFLSSGYDIHGGWCLNRARNISFVYMDIQLTEPEAVFLAGQWILDNKDNK